MNSATSIDVNTRIAKRLAEAVGPRRYAMWFDHSACLDYRNDDRTLRIAVPNQFVADWIGKHFDDNLRQAAHQTVGETVELDVCISPERFTRDRSIEPTSGEPQRAAAASPAAGEAARLDRLNHPPLRVLRHRLDDFVVGPCNELAFAAAERLATDAFEPGHPLFIHGSCGLGKTHLLQGICRQLLEQRPGARVLYTTGEQFTNEYITAVRSNKLEAFRKRIRQLDLLAVDDIHFIANKQATQQEFLHSFDQIELSGARVVLASDCHPKLIKQFSEALVSRCVRGLVVPIHTPDPVTRARLIVRLAQKRDLRLDEASVQRLARGAAGSVREIEGLLTKLQALANLMQRPGAPAGAVVSPRLVHQLFEDEPGQATRGPVRFETVMTTVCDELSITRQQVLGSSRHKLVVLARSLVIYLARQMTAMSYPEIATAMGRKNHSTIITADQRVQRQLKAEHEPGTSGGASGGASGSALPTLPPQVLAINLGDLTEQLRRRIARG